MQIVDGFQCKEPLWLGAKALLIKLHGLLAVCLSILNPALSVISVQVGMFSEWEWGPFGSGWHWVWVFTLAFASRWVRWYPSLKPARSAQSPLAKQRWRLSWSWMKADFTHHPLEACPCGESCYLCTHSAITRCSQPPLGWSPLWTWTFLCFHSSSVEVLTETFSCPSVSATCWAAGGWFVHYVRSPVLTLLCLWNEGIRENLSKAYFVISDSIFFTWQKPVGARGSISHFISITFNTRHVFSPSTKTNKKSCAVVLQACREGHRLPEVKNSVVEVVSSDRTSERMLFSELHHAGLYSFMTLGKVLVDTFPWGSRRTEVNSVSASRLESSGKIVFLIARLNY